MMQQKGWKYGGESSGHLLCLDCHTTGDGTISASATGSDESVEGSALERDELRHRTTSVGDGHGFPRSRVGDHR